MTLNETIIKLKNTRDYENLEEILGSELGGLLYQVVNKSKSEGDMRDYATEAIKADRERIKQSHADELPSELFNDLALGLGKDIDNLPIELP